MRRCGIVLLVSLLAAASGGGTYNIRDFGALGGDRLDTAAIHG